ARQAHNLKVVGSNPTPATTSNPTTSVGFRPPVDMPKRDVHDNCMTKLGRKRPKRKVVRVKFGSAQVPVYEGAVRGATRFTVSFYQNGRRVRRTFDSFAKATNEARTAAMKIQQGIGGSRRHADCGSAELSRSYVASRQPFDST